MSIDRNGRRDESPLTHQAVTGRNQVILPKAHNGMTATRSLIDRVMRTCMESEVAPTEIDPKTKNVRKRLSGEGM